MTDSEEQPSLVMLALREYQAALDAGTRIDRKAFLARNPAIAAELSECLDGLDYLMAAAPGLSAPGANPARPNSTLGDFQIICEIGRGGMGVVYEAVQISLDRRVALKVLPVAATFDARQLRRFENEARAAAGLHHTHIVPVFGVGCDRGVPYYAMQLIDGRPLSEIIDQLRKDPRPGPANADTAPDAAQITRQPITSRPYFRMVATLGVQAAEALEYAHQMGVVHRDVKPANLILDGRDHLWVTDFGLARIQTAPGATPIGDVIGTVRYMSPEQAAGDPAIDPRGDVYSLGATLYELLTLRPVFGSGDQAESLRQILEDDPLPPRSWNRSVPVELETIVLKALAKVPADRYSSAQELANDLRRFLDDRPVLARRPSKWDRARKWARRHPTAVAALLVGLLIAVLGLAASTVLVANEHARTQAAFAQERQRAEEAEVRLKLARRAVDDMLQFSEQELTNAPKLRPLRQRLVEVSYDYYQEMIELKQNDPVALAELSLTRDRIARILADIAVLRNAGLIQLLAEPAVLSDLKLSSEERVCIEELQQRSSERTKAVLRVLNRIPPSVRRDRYVDAARENEQDLLTVLKSEHLTRLQQITLQRQGLDAFREPDVIAALKLTPEQRERIRLIEFDSSLGPSGPLPAKMSDQSMRWTMRRILGSLTPPQRAQWQKLIGEPFNPAR